MFSSLYLYIPHSALLEPQIIKQWLALGFRPAYIIFEYLNLGEPEAVLIDRLRRHDYHNLGKRGWNYIFEHHPPEAEKRDTPGTISA